MITAKPHAWNTDGFVTTYLEATNRRTVADSAAWLEPVLIHPWFCATIRRIAHKRRRHATGISLSVLVDTLTSYFVVHVSADPWLGLDSSRAESIPFRIASWLDTRARHLFPKEFQERKHHSRSKGLVRHIDASSIDAVLDRPCETASPLDIAIQRERASELTRVLASLPSDERLVVCARVVDHKSVREIRGMLCVSKRCVYALYHRGIRTLRNELSFLS